MMLLFDLIFCAKCTHTKLQKNKKTDKSHPSFATTSCLKSSEIVTFKQLEVAVKNHDPNFSLLLNNYLKSGGNPYEQSLSGRTLLTDLVQHGQSGLFMLDALLPHLHKDTLNVPDGAGQRAISLAFELGDKTVIDRLVAKHLDSEMIGSGSTEEKSDVRMNSNTKFQFTM